MIGKKKRGKNDINSNLKEEKISFYDFLVENSKIQKRGP
jgi:hypothetical protein